MRRAAIAALLFVGSAVAFVGCDSPTHSGTEGGGTTRPTPAEKKRDVYVHVRTPGASVDVERHGTGKAKVDVRTKDQ
jgi:hypothetical protein